MKITLGGFVRLLCLLLLPLLAVACNDGFSNGSDDGGGGGGINPELGSAAARLSITDAPADDVARVQVTLRAVTLKPVGEDPIRVDPGADHVIPNLLALQGGATSSFGRARGLPEGEYEWLELEMVAGGSDSWVTTDTGGRYELFVAGAGTRAGEGQPLRVVRGFTLPGPEVDLVLDIDLRRALARDGNHFTLRPAFSLVDRSTTGSIRGTVADSLTSGFGCTSRPAADEGNAVYLYRGHNAYPGDVYVSDSGSPASGSNPVTVVPVRQAGSGLYEFVIPFVEAGDYTLAFTCQSLNDDPVSNDLIFFRESANVRVTVGGSTRQDLPTSGSGGGDSGGGDSGGEDPGGEDPGGEDPGGEDPGGEDPGGEDPGGGEEEEDEEEEDDEEDEDEEDDGGFFGS